MKILVKPALSLLPLAAILVAAGSFYARADDPVAAQKEVSKWSKHVAKDNEKVSEIQADIRTQQAKITQDTARYGASSNEVGRDNDHLRQLKEKLADRKADLQRDKSKRDAQSAGQTSLDSSRTGADNMGSGY